MSVRRNPATPDCALRLASEAVHVERPLQGDDRALDAREKGQRQRSPQQRMQPQRRREGALDGQDGADDHVAYDQDGEIGGRVVGAVVMEGLPAAGTRLPHLEIAGKQWSCAAGRTALRETLEE